MTRRILFTTLEPISKQMAGPAIRALELAKQLKDEHEVYLFSPYPCDLQFEDGLKLTCGLNKPQLYELAKSCDIIYIQANVLKPYPELSEFGKYIVLDLYDPYLLSVLAQYSDDPISSDASYRLMHRVLEKHMIKADFAICASERQRDYWIGRFCGIGRLTPEMYKFDPSFRKLIDVVPFGLPKDQPHQTASGIKGQVKGIDARSKVLLWGGGIWEWFDPITVIEAVAKLATSHLDLKLFFMGWKSPNPQVPLMDMAIKAKERAKALGVLDTHVIFHDSWVPYDKRANYLLDADIAVSAHFDLPETRFAFRTRILDYLWTGLPILTTGGDQLAEMIETNKAGFALPYGDVDAWVEKISQMLSDHSLNEELRAGSRQLAQKFTWQEAAIPLKEFCLNPYHLPQFSKVKMPSLFERAHAVYSRGGTDMVIKRSKNLLDDFLRSLKH